MIICVGSVFLDHIVKIDTFPKKPIKVLAQGIEKRLGGSAAVASFTIKKLGINTSFIGRLGNDDASKFLKNELKNLKLNIITLLRLKELNHHKVLFMRINKVKDFLLLLVKRNY